MDEATGGAGPEDGTEGGAGGNERTVISGADDGATRLAPVSEPAERTIIGTKGSAPKAQLVEPGTLINNNYRILALVSAGGMGEVYRAENVFTGDPVAVKVILPGLAGDSAVLDLFRREARVLVQMRHEAIVRYHNFVLDQGLNRYCLIMEFVDGRHLGKRLSEDGPLHEAEVIALLRRIGAGLQRAHDSGVTHRDLSPDNVILRDDRIDEAVLIDFGIARSTELGDGLAGRFAGKFKYIAPEQLGHAGGAIGPRTDIYGLALLIAAVARGTALDMGDSVVSASAARQAIPDLTGISHRLFPLLQHMLEPDPEKRPVSMGMALAMLDDPLLIPSRYRLPLWAKAGEAEEADAGPDSDSPFARFSPPPVEPLPEQAPARRRTGPWLAAGAGALMLAAGLGWWVLRPASAPVPAPDPGPVAPAELAARDTATREGFLASQPLPPCMLARRISSGPNTGMIALLGGASADGAALVAAYEQAFGTRATILTQATTPQQCPAIDFLREVAGRPSPPAELRVEARVIGDSIQIQGSVAIAPEQNLWLFLVAPDGAVYDLTAQLSAPDQGSRGFGFALSPDGQGQNGPFLLVALGSSAALAAVAAAPSGVPAADILPVVLEELRRAGGSLSVASELVALVPATPPAPTPAPAAVPAATPADPPVDPPAAPRP